MSEIIRLENDRFTALIDVLGAQLRSLRLKDGGGELIWPGEPAVWRDSAPWLFPVIGQLKDGYYTYDGKRYDMPMHGFAKRSLFAANHISESEAAFTLTDSAETLPVYPWRFRLEIAYRLEEGGLSVTATVENRDEKAMYYSLGGHPGLNCAHGDTLVFEGAPELNVYRLTKEGHLLRDEAERLSLPGGALSLSETLFAEDAMLLRGPGTRRVTLKRAQGLAVSVRFDEVPWLGIWSRGNIPLRYVCVEPWLGVDDPENADHDIARKLDIQTLQAGEVQAFHLSINPAL